MTLRAGARLIVVVSRRWMPNSNEVWYAMKDRIVLVDVDTKRHRVLRPEIAGPSNVSVSPDGRTFYLLTEQR